MRPEPPLVFHPSSLADLPLDLVIDRLDGGLGDEDGFLITLRDVRRGLQIGFRRLEEHPVDVLLGWRGARARSTPWASRCPAPPARSTPARGPTRRRAACASSSSTPGTVVPRPASGGWARTRRNVLDTGAAEGDVADCLRRAIGLPTPAPPCGPVGVVGGRLARRGARGGVPGAVRGAGRGRTCPGCTRCSGPLPPDSPAALVELVAREGAGLDWSEHPAPRGRRGRARAARSVPSWRPGWTTGCSPGGSSAPGPTRSTWWSISSICCRRRSPGGWSRPSRRGAAGEPSERRTDPLLSPCGGPEHQRVRRPHRHRARRVRGGVPGHAVGPQPVGRAQGAQRPRRPGGDQPVRARVRHDRLPLGPSPRGQRLRRGHHRRGLPLPGHGVPAAGLAGRPGPGQRAAAHRPRSSSVGVQLCDALGAAHRAGVLHRDIKPENVLVDVAGQCKLADFGVAAVVEGVDSRDTAPGHAPRHGAPPRARGARGRPGRGRLATSTPSGPRSRPSRSARRRSRGPTTRPSSRR